MAIKGPNHVPQGAPTPKPQILSTWASGFATGKAPCSRLELWRTTWVTHLKPCRTATTVNFGFERGGHANLRNAPKMQSPTKGGSLTSMVLFVKIRSASHKRLVAMVATHRRATWLNIPPQIQSTHRANQGEVQHILAATRGCVFL